MENPTRTVTADFSAEAYDALSMIAEKLHVSKAEALRRSLGLARFVLQEQQSGWKMILENEGREERKEILSI